METAHLRSDVITSTAITQPVLSEHELSQITKAASLELSREKSNVKQYRRDLKVADDGSNQAFGGNMVEGSSDHTIKRIASAQIDHAENLVTKLQTRLDDIASGSFTGICIVCKKPIEIERLLASPSTKRHASCKDRKKSRTAIG